jgi:ADP-ribose pyrophosphatase YjhB (NUDIX family)
MEEKTLFEATVTFPVRDGQVLLGMKMQKIGKDCWNGYGGGVEEGDESIESRALLELNQECGLIGSPSRLVKVAVCYFKNTKSDSTIFVAKVHIYLLHDWEGEPHATSEMDTPTLFPFAELPLDRMMPADRHWVPRVLAGERLRVRAHYGPFQKELLSIVEIDTVREFE